MIKYSNKNKKFVRIKIKVVKIKNMVELIGKN
jgi:hypothetical protein